MKIKPLKLRRGRRSKELVIVNWDFDQMLYSEVEDPEEGFVDDEKVPF